MIKYSKWKYSTILGKKFKKRGSYCSICMNILLRQEKIVRGQKLILFYIQTWRCWRRFLRVPWTARRSNQSIWKDINPEYSLEGLMLKQKLKYFGHLMWRTNLLDKTLILGKDWGQEEDGSMEDKMFGWYHLLNGH